MELVSINRKFTVDGKQVAFNIQNPPSAEVIESASHGNLTVKFLENDTVLLVIVPPGQGDLLQGTVVSILSEIKSHEETRDRKIDAEAKAHEEHLKMLAGRFGLPIGD